MFSARPAARQLHLALSDALRVVVGLSSAAAQHDMGMGVAPRSEYGGLPVLRDPEEVVRALHRRQRIDRHRERAIRAVLEAHRGRQAGGHLAVGLRLGGARADGRPGDQLRQILRHDRVEGFGGRRQPAIRKLDQKTARQPDALLDVEGVVHVRIVDQALPADRGARLFEVDAHDQHHGGAHALGQLSQAVGVLPGGFQIVDRARPHHDEEARVPPGQDVAHHASGRVDEVLRRAGQGQLLLDLVRRGQQLAGCDVDVEKAVAHRSNAGI